MHMADALVSPAVGGTMWAASAGLAAWSARRLRNEMYEQKVPLMGVLGAFVFAAQMINFTIPMTGSSGHLAGGLLLAILLGPHAAFLVLFSILAVQALFFADGGILALGCNVFNMGFWPCFVAYPLIFRKLAGDRPREGRIMTGAVLSGIIALQLGSLGVVLQTWLSGISELPLGTFVLLMQPIHLAIGIVEGLVTALLVAFVWKARPEIIELAGSGGGRTDSSSRPVLIAFAAGALLVGGCLSWFASGKPDGLEWSAFKTSGSEEIDAPDRGLHRALATLQEKTSLMPDYGFKPVESQADVKVEDAGTVSEEEQAWPAVETGTSLSGLLGGLMVLLLAGLTGLSLRVMRKPEQ